MVAQQALPPRPPFFFRIAGYTHIEDANGDNRIDNNDNVIILTVPNSGKIIISLAHSDFVGTIINVISTILALTGNKLKYQYMFSTIPNEHKLGRFAMSFNRHPNNIGNTKSPVLDDPTQNIIIDVIKLMFLSKAQTQASATKLFGGKSKKI